MFHAYPAVEHPFSGLLEVDVGCQSATFSRDIFGKDFVDGLSMLQMLGYRRVVLGPLDFSDENIKEVRNKIRDFGLMPIVMAYQSQDANVASEDSSIRSRGYDLLLRIIDMTYELGGDQITGVPYGVHGDTANRVSSMAIARAARLVGKAADRAAESEIMMSFEVLNRYETPIVNTASDAMQFVEDSESQHLRIHLDTFHMSIEETDMSEAIKQALPRLGYLEFGQSSRGMLSAGLLDLPEIYRQTESMGYRGRYGIEGFSSLTLKETVADQLKIWRPTFSLGQDFLMDAATVFSHSNRNR